MLKKLRRRFILITMSLVGVVLAAVLVVGCVGAYNNQLNLITSALHAAVQRGPDEGFAPWVGSQPDSPLLSDNGSSTTAADSVFPVVPDGNAAVGDEDGKGGRDGGGFALRGVQGNNTPVFIITYNTVTGTFTAENNGVEMDAALLAEAVVAVAEASADSGLLPSLSLFYERGVGGRGFDSNPQLVRMAFANAEPLLASTLQQAGLSLLIGVVALLVFFGISIFLSRIALAPVEKAWEQQRRFIADASHELKTPLTVILANNNIIASQPASRVAEQQQWLDSTQAEAQRMDGLIRDLLLLAQTEEDTGAKDGGEADGPAAQDAAAAPVQFSAVVNRMLLQFEAVLYERGIELESDVAPGLSVAAEAGRLERLVSILLDNASKYGGGGRPVRVSLQAIDDGKTGLVQLQVNNGGETVPPEVLEHIFERFYRGDSSHSDAVEGYGLGLSIAQNIVHGLGGTITAASSAEEGTTFTVQLPKASVN